MKELLEHDPPPPSGGRRLLTVVAALALAVLVIPRLIDADEPSAEPPPAQRDEEPAGISAPRVADGVGQPIADAPVRIRMIELVTASRLGLFHGQIGADVGPTTLASATPYATDAVTVLAYGAGVVVGPAPGTPVPGAVQIFGVDVLPPPEPVNGILPAIGGGYWIMETATATTTAGPCQMHLVMMSGQMSHRSITHPCQFVPERETVSGFVGRASSGGSASTKLLFDPQTGAVSAISGGLLAASERLLVRWTRELSDPLVVEDLASGNAVEVALPPGRSTRQVALDQTGRYLAVVLVERLITIRSYEIWVYDLVDGGGRMATVTTLDSGRLELVWRGGVLVVVGSRVEAYDVDRRRLYRSAFEPPPSLLDAVAMSFALQERRA